MMAGGLEEAQWQRMLQECEDVTLQRVRGMKSCFFQGGSAPERSQEDGWEGMGPAEVVA